MKKKILRFVVIIANEMPNGVQNSTVEVRLFKTTQRML